MSDIISKANQSQKKFDAVQAIYYFKRESGDEPKLRDVVDLFRKTKHSSGDWRRDYNLVSVYLTNIRKLEKRGASAEIANSRATTVSAGAPTQETSSIPTVDELEAVLDAAEGAGGITAFAESARSITGLIERLGGSLNKLETCLGFLERRLSSRKK
jgi:hypothetical protein